MGLLKIVYVLKRTWTKALRIKLSELELCAQL
jgi:hypothetical protein